MVSLLGLANLGLLTTRPRRIGGSWIIAHKKRTCGTGIRRKNIQQLRENQEQHVDLPQVQELRDVES